MHAHQYTPFFQSLLARGLSRRLPIVFTEHGRQYPDYRRPKRVVCNRVLVQKRDRLIAVGESVRQALIDFEGLTASRVEVIRNGVGLDDYLKAGADERLRCQVRSELNLQDGEFTVLQVARLNELKDHATAVRTIAHLRDQGLRARLLLAGDGEERAAIEQRVMELNLRDQVTLLGTRRDVPRLLAACDAFLLTSISEGIPLTLIEAMAASRPVVSTKVGGVGEIVVPGETGFLAPAGDPVWLARHLAELRSRPERRHAFGEAGRQRAIAEFDQQKMLDAYAGVYSQALSDCRSARSANGHSSERPPMEPVA